MKNKKKVVAIIQARTGSTRLPNKVLKSLLGKPVIWHVINRVKKSGLIDQIVLATTNKKEDLKLVEIASEMSIGSYVGSEKDVLDRYFQAATEYKADVIVRITADCPLHDPNVIDLVIKEYLDGEYDYVSNTLEYTFPDGYDVEVFSFSALKEAHENAKLPSEREHVTPYMRKNEKFKKKNAYSKKKYPLYRCTLDQSEDYEFITKIYMGMKKEMFYIDDVINYLDSHPELLKINQWIKINEGYLKSLEEDKIVE